jgi:hypothetical protein
MNVDMIWDNPPDKGQRSSKWSQISDKLKANPGKWAKLKEAPVARNAHGLAGRLRTKFGTDYEVIARSTGPNSAGVWARYNPDPDDMGYALDVVATGTGMQTPIEELDDSHRVTFDDLTNEDGGGAGL